MDRGSSLRLRVGQVHHLALKYRGSADLQVQVHSEATSSSTAGLSKVSTGTVVQQAEELQLEASEVSLLSPSHSHHSHGTSVSGLPVGTAASHCQRHRLI